MSIHGAFAKFTVAGIVAGTLEYNGRVISVTPTGAGTTGEAAALFATGFADSYLGRYFYFVADEANSELYVFAKSGNPGDIVTSDGVVITGGAITLAEDATVIGTVSSVEESTGNVILAANAALDVPAGISIGVPVRGIEGLIELGYDLDDARPTHTIGIYTRGKVYRQNLPYYDDTIAVDLPEIDAKLPPY